MKTKIMRALSIEIGPESYPRWPVPVVRAPVAQVWVAEPEKRAVHLGVPATPVANCAHGLLIASGALYCWSLPLLSHYVPAVSVVNV